MDESNRTPHPGRGEGLSEDYANNTAFEATVWDLKLIFGEWSQRTGSVEWHTSITVSWAQAKLLNHFLAVNIAAHEIVNGKIRVPDSALPAPVAPPSGEVTDAKAPEVFKMFQEQRESFLRSLKDP